MRGVKQLQQDRQQYFDVYMANSCCRPFYCTKASYCDCVRSVKVQTSDLVYGNTLLSAAHTELLGLGATACALRTIRKLSEKTVSEHYSEQ